MTTQNDTRHTWPAPIDELLATVPLFDGFPYLSTRLVPAAYHIRLLPDGWTREQLTDALWRQVAANQLSTALVLSEHLAIYLSPAGGLCEGPAPRSSITLAGGLLTPEPLTPEQLGDRAGRLALVVEAIRRAGGTLFGDLGKGGHEATAEERARLGGRRPREGRRGLARCATCGEWRGQCLDRIPGYPRNWVVPVHCRCDNVTCCARCGQPFSERRVGGNHLDERDGAIWHSPGFMALQHRCAGEVESDRLPLVERSVAVADPRSLLVYGEGPHGLVFVEGERAPALHAFYDAATWGDLRRSAPDLYETIVGELEDDSWVRDDTPLDRTEVPGFCDGDFFFPEREMLDFIPDDIQEQYGVVESTAFNGDMLSIGVEHEAAVLDALERAGFRCDRDQALIDKLFA